MNRILAALTTTLILTSCHGAKEQPIDFDTLHSEIIPTGNDSLMWFYVEKFDAGDTTVMDSVLKYQELREGDRR